MDLLLKDLLDDPRVSVRTPGEPNRKGRCVVYWMQRSHRGIDNPALDITVEVANRLKLPAVVYLAPIPWYPHANLRHYLFLQEGIPDIKRDIEKRGIGFVLRRWPDHSLDRFLAEVDPAMLIGDENPMREPEHWRQVVAKRCKVSFVTVDSDVVVPSNLFDKEQYAAFQFRKKIYAQLDRFLVAPENSVAQHKWHPPAGLENLPVSTEITEGWDIDRSVPPVDAFRGGSSEAQKLLDEFVARKLAHYSVERNQADRDGTTRLSPYLHFGHISPLTIALAAKKARVPAAQKEALYNELIVWREVSINLVKFNPNYDNFDCADRWARESLLEHAEDKRDHVYTREQFEAAQTHDELWNAAQRQMLSTGWMHNYMRMYWAKKILDWTPDPRTAYDTAVYLNDKYFLCGRDPNGYAGVAWAIVGKRDRPWFTRAVGGKVRPMAASGAAKKFNVNAYIRQWSGDTLFS